MTLEPFFAASLIIKIHMVTMFAAIILTPSQLVRRKGTTIHRMAGYGWMAAMFIAAASSLAIKAHGSYSILGFSPIHLLSLLVIVNVPIAIIAARSGNIKRHKAAVMGMVLGGIMVAGIFTLVPGRIMHRIIFGG